METSKTENTIMIAKAGAGVREMRFLSKKRPELQAAITLQEAAVGLCREASRPAGLEVEWHRSSEKLWIGLKSACLVKMSQQKHTIKIIAFL